MQNNNGRIPRASATLVHRTLGDIKVTRLPVTDHCVQWLVQSHSKAIILIPMFEMKTEWKTWYSPNVFMLGNIQ